jgi:hypothetical protein
MPAWAPRRAIAVICALVVALDLDMEVDRIRDPLISAARHMLVDQRGTFASSPGPLSTKLHPERGQQETEHLLGDQHPACC